MFQYNDSMLMNPPSKELSWLGVKNKIQVSGFSSESFYFNENI